MYLSSSLYPSLGFSPSLNHLPPCSRLVLAYAACAKAVLVSRHAHLELVSMRTSFFFLCREALYSTLTVFFPKILTTTPRNKKEKQAFTPILLPFGL